MGYFIVIHPGVRGESISHLRQAQSRVAALHKKGVRVDSIGYQTKTYAFTVEEVGY